jgi:hypothetical protein
MCCALGFRTGAVDVCAVNGAKDTAHEGEKFGVVEDKGRQRGTGCGKAEIALAEINMTEGNVDVTDTHQRLIRCSTKVRTCALSLYCS